MCLNEGRTKYVIYDKNENLFEANWPASYFEDKNNGYKEKLKEKDRKNKRHKTRVVNVNQLMDKISSSDIRLIRVATIVVIIATVVFFILGF